MEGRKRVGKRKIDEDEGREEGMGEYK